MSQHFDRLEQDLGDVPAEPGSGWVVIGLVVALLFVILIAASPNPSHCAAIAQKAARLACFDAATSAEPAKGGFVPHH